MEKLLVLPVRVQWQRASIGSRTVQREATGDDYAFPMAFRASIGSRPRDLYEAQLR